MKNKYEWTDDDGREYVMYYQDGPLNFTEFSVSMPDVLRLRDYAEAAQRVRDDAGWYTQAWLVEHGFPAEVATFIESTSPKNVSKLLETVRNAWRQSQTTLGRSAQQAMAQSVADLMQHASNREMKHMLLTIAECIAASGKATGASDMVAAMQKRIDGLAGESADALREISTLCGRPDAGADPQSAVLLVKQLVIQAGR